MEKTLKSNSKKISIHALREEGDRGAGRHRRATGRISIHALREESDVSFPASCRDRKNFYPRPPRGGRPDRQHTRQARALFLSTPSARRATQCATGTGCHQSNFYPRPPRGGRPCWMPHGRPTNKISIHALREEGDSGLPGRSSSFHDFYPRPPRGGRPTKTTAASVR